MSVFSPEVEITNVPDVTVSAGVSVNNFPATQNVAVTNTPTVNIGTIPEVEIKNDVGNPIPVTSTPVVSNTSNINQLTSTGVNQTLLSPNVNRKKAILYFSSGTWHVKLGIGASATSRTILVNSNNFYWELNTWTGQIDALCTTSGKLVDVTELV